MSVIQIKTIQTRMNHYPVFHIIGERNYRNGYYFFDEELEEIYAKDGNYGYGYFGPYHTLDEACAAQYKHHCAIDSL